MSDTATAEAPALAPPAQDVSVDTRVAQFIRLRDKIDEIEEQHKNALKPYKETLEILSGVLMDHLNKSKSDSVAIKGVGTFYRKTKKSATLADKPAFWSFVVATGNWDLLDYKANAPAVAEYLDKLTEEARTDPNVQVAPPPGVNYTVTQDVGVRRASAPKV